MRDKWISPAEFNKARCRGGGGGLTCRTCRATQARRGVSRCSVRAAARATYCATLARRDVRCRNVRFALAAHGADAFARRTRGQVFAVYQALPGPEATELCCYFGQLANGKIGGLIGGLAFCAPGAHCAPACNARCGHFDLRLHALARRQASASCCCSHICTDASTCSRSRASSPPSTPCGARGSESLHLPTSLRMLTRSITSSARPCVPAMCVRAVFKISEHALVDHFSKSHDPCTMLVALAVRVPVPFRRKRCVPLTPRALLRRPGHGHAFDIVWHPVLRVVGLRWAGIYFLQKARQHTGALVKASAADARQPVRGIGAAACTGPLAGLFWLWASLGTSSTFRWRGCPRSWRWQRARRRTRSRAPCS